MPATITGASYSYEEMRRACKEGRYPCVRIRTACGRANDLLGVSPQRLALLRRKAREAQVGFVVVGSRVSGPRLRQRTLHPALAACLPLKCDKRAASALFPGAEGVEIDKTVIKDFGPDDARTSDLSILLVDARRGPAELRVLAAELEGFFAAQGWGFPVRFFAELTGRLHREEDDFLETGERYLRGLLPPGTEFSGAQLREAMRELYFTVNLGRRALNAADLRNGAVTAALFCASFSLGLGFHFVLLPIGFLFGVFGRYLARMRAGVAFVLGDGVAANAAALLFDAAQGAAVMACVINPAAGLGLPLRVIVAGSLAHTLAKGSLRLFLDKAFSTGNEARQGGGVLLVNLLSFAQGVVTSFVYAGSRAAQAVQGLLCVAGAALLFGPAARRGLRSLLGERAGL